MKKWLLFLAVAFGFPEVEAQSRDQQVRAQVDSALTERYYKSPYDTSYVARPEGRLTRRNAKHFSFGMIFNERAAVVYNFSPRYFAGATLTMSNSFYDNDVTVNQNKWARPCLRRAEIMNDFSFSAKQLNKNYK